VTEVDWHEIRLFVGDDIRLDITERGLRLVFDAVVED
jgi:hypothetical protein